MGIARGSGTEVSVWMRMKEQWLQQVPDAVLLVLISRQFLTIREEWDPNRPSLTSKVLKKMALIMFPLVALMTSVHSWIIADSPY